MLLRIVIIDLALLLGASLLDIVLSALLQRFSSGLLTMVCFAVAGVFAGLFCYIPAVEKVQKEERAQASKYIMLLVTVFSILLIYPVAPLSGSDYDWPFKTFAVAQLLMAVFLWKQKLYRDV
ncbi:MAG: hypothetical protein QM687_08160 [Ferruginibacter sp.]